MPTVLHDTERYQVVRRIGVGGMGEVYEAIDRRHNGRVALKVLTAMTPDSLLRFKNEFRSLQDFEHPNLVGLGDLFEEGGRWFFTMEYVAGKDFLSYVRGTTGSNEIPSRPTFATVRDSQECLPSTQSTITLAAPADRDLGGGVDWNQRLWQAQHGSPPSYDEARLREALAQLARGLMALHSAGRVHRDIKPSNLLVTPEGRVVIIDFGLITEIQTTLDATVDQIVGTPAFMAPEQASSNVGPEADWYSFGVVLYVALTGRLPIDGRGVEQLAAKQRFQPLPPRALVDTVPDDLDTLCVELLRIDPQSRPSGREVMRRLNVPLDDELSALATDQISQLTGTSTFVGRSGELGILADRFEQTRTGRCSVVFIYGESGIGKTALVRAFTDRVAVEREAVILRGRCYEAETVPFKAVDGVVDALSRYLVSLPPSQAAALVPRRVALLAQAFPVLRRVQCIATAPAPLGQLRDPQELRAQVFSAMRELLERVAERHPLVLVIDDLQWTDTDSLSLLRELLRSPEPPALLLIATMRSVSGQHSNAADELAAALSDDVLRFALDRLPPDDARQLALQLLDCEGDEAAGIADEAGGHPLFINELVRNTAAMGRQSKGAPILEEVLWARIERLDPAARRILDLLAVAGAPVQRAVMAHAAGLEFAELSRRLLILRTTNLVRTGGARHAEAIETYHDRIRAAVSGHLDPVDRRFCHERLAIALEASEQRDFEALTVHWQGAGDLSRAHRYSLLAANQATEALAFGQAARLYRLALALRSDAGTGEWETRLKLADSLANAGHGAEAAPEYMAVAAANVDAADALEYRRRGAEQLLLSGRFKEGLDALHTVLAAIGMSLPRTPRRAVLSLISSRTRLRLRGLRFRERDASQVSAEELRRIDIGWSAAIGLAATDTIRGADATTRNLLVALRTGEPNRVSRILSAELALSALDGEASLRRTTRLTEVGGALVAKLGDPLSLGLYTGVVGIAACLHGRWKRGRESCSLGETILRERCTGVSWEIVTCQTFEIYCLGMLGEVRTLSRLSTARLSEANDRGDLYASTNFRTAMGCLIWLGRDAPDEAIRQAHEAMMGWPADSTHVQHFYEIVAVANAQLYRGNASAALAAITERWPVLKRAYLFRIAIIRAIMLDLRARAQVAVAAGDPTDRARLVKAALADAAALDRTPFAAAGPLARIVRAGVAMVREDPETALTWLGQAIPALEAADMNLHVMAARRRRGIQIGGDEGRAEIRSADQWMAGQGIANPECMTAMMTPGFPG